MPFYPCLLSPIGHHGTNHTSISKGKRSKKRKRAEAKAATKDKAEEIPTPNTTNPSNPSPSEPPPQPPPPPPEILHHLTLGLNSTTRHLETLSQHSLPTTYPSHLQIPNLEPPPRHLAAIFVSRSGQASILHSHLPTLAITASLSHASLPPTRLVSLSEAAESRLAAALGIPRVGIVGLMEDAPHAKGLVDYVREHVSIVRAEWLEEVSKGAYLPVKINAISTTAPVLGKKEKGREKEGKGRRRKRKRGGGI